VLLQRFTGAQQRTQRHNNLDHAAPNLAMSEQCVDSLVQALAATRQCLDQLARNRIVGGALGIAQQIDRATHSRQRRAEGVREVRFVVLAIIHVRLRIQIEN
jgi:hypothetical protein